MATNKMIKTYCFPSPVLRNLLGQASFNQSKKLRKSDYTERSTKNH